MNTLLEDGVLAPPVFLRHAVALLQVAARAERPVAPAGENGAADALAVHVQRAHELQLLEPHQGVARVRDLRPVEHDQQDMLVDPFDVKGSRSPCA